MPPQKISLAIHFLLKLSDSHLIILGLKIWGDNREAQLKGQDLLELVIQQLQHSGCEASL